jgi:hypothetical protein
MRTGGSVIIATLFHGAVNTFGIVNAGAGAAQRGWGNALSYGAVALALSAMLWHARSRTSAALPERAASSP